MAPTEHYRERATVEGIRAELSERRVRLLWRRWLEEDVDLEWRNREIARLRSVAERQAHEILRLREELREAEERGRQTAMRSLLESVLSAVETGSRALSGLRLARLEAEIKGLFDVRGGEGELVIGAPSRPTARGELSTVRFEVRPVPSTPHEDELARLLLPVSGALLELQRALDRDFGSALAPAAATALATLSALLAAPLSPPSALERALTGLAGDLDELAASHPPLSEALSALSAQSPLPAEPTREAARARAGALERVARVIEEMPG